MRIGQEVERRRASRGPETSISVPVSAMRGEGTAVSADARRSASARPRRICSSGRSSQGMSSSCGSGAITSSRRQILAGEIVGDGGRHVASARDARRPSSAPPRPSRRTARPARHGRARRRAPGPDCGDARRAAPRAPRRVLGRAAPRLSERRMPPRICSRALAHRPPPALPLGPQALEAAALGRRHVAHRGPAAGQRQACGSGRARRRPSRAARAPTPAASVIERRALRDPGPELTGPCAIRRRAELLREFALAPMAHHLGQRDLAPGRRSRSGRRRSRRWADGRPRRRRSGSASAPRPSARDRPSHRRGRRPRHRPGNG